MTTYKLSEIVGGGYREFWHSKKRYRVLKGGKGSKKSATTSLNFILRLTQYPEANLLVVRSVMDTHRSSTFAQLTWAIRRLGMDGLFKCTVSPMEITYLPTGQKILFRGFDDVLKLASITVPKGVLCWVWIEEAYEILSEEQFDVLDLSVPRGNVPEGLFKQTTLTFNPWNEHHWLKKRFFDHPPENADVFTTNYLCNEFLDDADRAVYERMKEENPRRYRVAGLGEWGVAEGLVFENWRVEACGPDSIPPEDRWKWRPFFGLDYGYTNDPTAFVACMANPLDKQLFIFDEHYQRRMLNDDIAKMITAKGYAKERIRADAAEPKSNDDLRRLGIGRIMAAEKGRDSILHGIARLQEYRITISPGCPAAIAEFSSYAWEPGEDGNPSNKPADTNNHMIDALRYASEDFRFFHPVTPEEEEKRMRRAAYTEAGAVGAAVNGGWDG